MTANSAPPRPAPIPLGQEPRPQRPAPGPSSEPRKRPASKPAKGNRPKRDRRKADRFAPLNAFVHLGALARVRGRATAAVYIALFALVDRRTGCARVAQATLARLAGCTDRTVRTAVAELEHLGAVAVHYRGNEFGGVSIYRLTVPPEPGGET